VIFLRPAEQANDEGITVFMGPSLVRQNSHATKTSACSLL
jgi:alpha-D-ribose 1-methylphosphonate 5-triphosphate diphosphatase PhnM